MNFQLAVEKLFPDCPFEGQIVGEDDIEVLGLARAMVPQNCEVLASGEFQYSLKEPVHRTYLVKADNRVLQVRIFSAFNGVIFARITPQRSGAPYELGAA